jgi:hypothetical protein
MATFPGLYSALFGLVLGACSTTRPPSEPARVPEASELAIIARLVQLDAQFGEHLGQRHVDVLLSNRSAERVTCRVAPEWLDAKGQTTPARDWQVVDLAAGAEARLRFGPMPAGARSYVLRFAG